MISIELVDQLPNEEDFKILEPEKYPCLFLGFTVRTEYDNKRLCIAPQYNPIKFFHLSEDEKTIEPLYGILLSPNSAIKSVLKIILEQEKNDNVSLPVYENILNQHNFSCKETYRLFERGTYPIDFSNLKDVCDDAFNIDKKIFQHMLSLDEEVFDFQKFASLKLFLLTA